MIRGSKPALTVLGLFWLVSCSSEPATFTPSEPVARSRREKIKVTKDVPTKVKDVHEKKKKEAPAFVYNASGRRDPFKPFLIKQVSLSKMEEDNRPKTPLQTYNINELKLVAIIWDINKPAAMVEAPDGKGYIIRKGTLIGDRNGKVMRVYGEKVVVRERFRDVLGDIREDKVVLELPKSEGEEFK